MTGSIWLHTNRRAVWFGLFVLLPLPAVAIGCVLMSPSGWLRWTAVVVASILAYCLAAWAYSMFPPRLTYANEQLHVRLRPGPPIQVPIDVVECFFLGQGPTLLTRPFGDHDKVEETSTIVVRLAESAEPWKHFDVKLALGSWCDGYAPWFLDCCCW